MKDLIKATDQQKAEVSKSKIPYGIYVLRVIFILGFCISGGGLRNNGIDTSFAGTNAYEILIIVFALFVTFGRVVCIFSIGKWAWWTLIVIQVLGLGQIILSVFGFILAGDNSMQVMPSIFGSFVNLIILLYLLDEEVKSYYFTE